MLPADGGESVAVSALLEEIAASGEIEGVTFLGGEPFAQAAPLAVLGARVRERGLGVMVFSGYTLEELRASRDPGVAELLAVTDLLVDGRYERERASAARRFVGSDNQRVHAFGARYAHLVRPGGWPTGSATVEVRIDGARVFVSGTPDATLATALRRLGPSG
jgi:anaerobic ribonucleoside-triphosphate reductase activating protein